MIRVVTDSSAGMPPAMVREYGIEVIPLYVMFGAQSLRDQIDITNEEFYNRLQTDATFPTTSGPSVGDFRGLYERLVGAGDQVLSVHVTSKLSGTYNAAVQAAAALPAGSVTVLDSDWVSMPLGFLARAAAVAARASGSVTQAVEAVRQLSPRLRLYFILDTLDNIRRSGRISGAQAILGGLLQVKPILRIAEGKVEAADQPRTRRRAMARLIEIMAADVGDGAALHVAFLHAHGEAGLDELEQQVRQRFEVIESLRAEGTPPVGAHVGVGAIGVAYYAAD